MSLADPVLDLEDLLQPLPGENPAGVSLRHSAVYDEIKEARREDPNYDQGQWARELKVADWRKVVDVAVKATRKQSKDLQVASWLVEGLVKRNHNNRFGGLRDGLKLIRGLHDNFWEHFYPEIDPEDDEDPVSARVYIFEALERVLAEALPDVPVTNSEITNLQYSWRQCQDSKRFALPADFETLSEDERKTKRAEVESEARAANSITAEQWLRAQNGTPLEYFQELNECLAVCREELQALNQVFDQYYEKSPPSLRDVAKALEDVGDLVQKICKERQPPPEVAEPEPAGGEAGLVAENSNVGGASGGSALSTGGVVRNRQEAFRRLAEVADFFHHTEPHSPVSYLVRRAIKYGQMPLEKWLEEVLKESAALENLRETLGIKSGSEGDGSA